MRQFGAYTLDALLAMPFPAFAALFELANRAQADFTLETVVAGIMALEQGQADKLYDRRDGVSRPPVPPLRRLTAEEMAMAKTGRDLSGKTKSGRFRSGIVGRTPTGPSGSRNTNFNERMITYVGYGISLGGLLPEKRKG